MMKSIYRWLQIHGVMYEMDNDFIDNLQVGIIHTMLAVLGLLIYCGVTGEFFLMNLFTGINILLCLIILCIGMFRSC